MSCSYSNIAMHTFNLKALNHKPALLSWKRFRDDIFMLWNQSLEEMNNFFDCRNRIDTNGKIKLTMSVANEYVLMCV